MYNVLRAIELPVLFLANVKRGSVVSYKEAARKCDENYLSLKSPSVTKKDALMAHDSLNDSIERNVGCRCFVTGVTII